MILFNSIVERSIYPTKLKEAIIHPIHKSGSTNDPLNYRPVSVPISLNKIIERELYEQIENHMTENDLSDIYQYGFKKERGCADLIAKIIALTSKAVDNGKCVVLISLDLSKAFDMINHEILIMKLRKMGFNNAAIKLMESYLEQRVQYVKINDTLSYAGTITSGVPQGTNLGPLLFSIYVCDMKYLQTNSKIFKFADDTMLMFEFEKNEDSVKNGCRMMREDLQLLSSYYANNHLKLNIAKSQAMVIGKIDKNVIQQALSEFGIDIKESLKYLGVQIDADLKFSSFMQVTKTKLNQSVGVIAVLRKTLLVNPLKSFYFAHFQSHLIYAPFLLLRLQISELQQLQRLQNRIIKLMFKLPYLTPTSELFTNHATNILPIMGMIFYFVCLMVHKSLYAQHESLIKVQKLQSLRSSLLKMENSKLIIRSNDIEIIGPSIFNSLPAELREIQTPSIFKTRLKAFLLSISASLATNAQISSKSKII